MFTGKTWVASPGFRFSNMVTLRRPRLRKSCRGNSFKVGVRQAQCRLSRVGFKTRRGGRHIALNASTLPEWFRRRKGLPWRQTYSGAGEE